MENGAYHCSKKYENNLCVLEQINISILNTTLMLSWDGDVTVNQKHCL
jgi:hypothetical protein